MNYGVGMIAGFFVGWIMLVAFRKILPILDDEMEFHFGWAFIWLIVTGLGWAGVILASVVIVVLVCSAVIACFVSPENQEYWERVGEVLLDLKWLKWRVKLVKNEEEGKQHE